MDWAGRLTAFQQPVRHPWAIAVLLVCGWAPLQSATLQQLTFDDLVLKSTAIVHGKVTGSYAAFLGPVIYTHYSIQVTESLKGSNSGAVDVVVPGGAANHLRQIFAGAPQFQNGDEYVFFLWTGPSGLTQIMGLTQGLFQLSSSASATVTATRAASSELMLDPRSGRPVKDQTLVMSLNDLKAQIASRLAAGAAQ